MKINALYRKYFQKSKIFLYPLLGLKRGTSVVPSHTYIAWDGKYEPEDMKLICLYQTRSDKEYVDFEKNVLLKHNRLHDCIKINDEESVFIFDFSDCASDWDCFLNGRYSQLSTSTKNRVLDFFEKNSGSYVYITSYLDPVKWFDRYAELLGVEKSELEKVGELCSKPDLDKEKLVFVVANLENIEILD